MQDFANELAMDKHHGLLVVYNGAVVVDCESGDILAKHRICPEMHVGDTMAMLDAGAYGYCMASNYNNRLRPAEVLIRENGEAVLVRERDELEDLTRHMKSIE